MISPYIVLMPANCYNLSMSGKLVEFPRKLIWKHVDTWYGHVAGTAMYTKVEQKLEGEGFNWGAWNGPMLIQAGEADSVELAQSAAKKAMEDGIIIIRALPAKVNR